jgi:hypothetical protein
MEKLSCVLGVHSHGHGSGLLIGSNCTRTTGAALDSAAALGGLNIGLLFASEVWLPDSYDD